MPTRIMNQLQPLAMNKGQQTQEKTAERTRTNSWKASVSDLGQPAPPRSARTVGPDEFPHRGPVGTSDRFLRKIPILSINCWRTSARKAIRFATAKKYR